MNTTTTITTIMEQQRVKRKRLQRVSYAKVNLYLEILRKRKDGFHDIRTVFSEISLSDEIIFTLTKNQEIKIWSFPEIVNGENNIIYKVAVFIKDKYRVNQGVEITLKKSIPHQAGLGGGSSNAATTIKALDKLWSLNLSEREMNLIAQKFGSDINFFLKGGTAIGYGRGEKITESKDIIIENMLIVKPDFGISTKEAYGLISEYKVDNKRWNNFLETGDIKYSYNAFEKPLLKKYPKLRKIFDIIKNENSKPLLSGSGSCVIAFCKDKKSAESLKEKFANKSYWTYITKTMRRRK